MRSPFTRRSVLNAEVLEGREMPANLIFGDIVEGSVPAGSQGVSWTFNGTSGDRIELISTSTPTQAGFRAIAEVFGPSGERVTWFVPDSNTQFDLPETGTFTLKIRDDNFTESGNYTIGYEGFRPISPNPGELALGDIISGAIVDRTGKDQWTFTGTEGDRIELISTSTPTQPGFRAIMEVFGPSGSRVTWFVPDSNTQFDLPETGTYMIQVRDDDFQQTGEYTIGYEGIKPISPEPGSLVMGQIARGEIVDRTGKDQWTFTGTEGDRIELISTSTATRGAFRAIMEVFGPSGSRVTWFVPDSNTQFDLPETGTYTIQVRDDDFQHAGKYTIGYEGLNPRSPNPSPMLKGKIVSGSIGERTEKDQWTFTGTEGERVVLISTSTATGGAFRAIAEVFGPSGERVTWFVPNSDLVLDLPESGEFVVQIRDDDFQNLGNYTIGFESLNPTSPDAKQLPAGQLMSGSIKEATKKDQWVIRVPEGKRLKVTLTGTAKTPGFSVFAGIYDSAGNRVTWMTGGKQVFTLEPGVYTIQVSDAALTKKGTYTLKAKPVV